MSLAQDDVERIAAALAPKLIEGVKAQQHDFWIDPEAHYQDHLLLRSLKADEIADLKQLINLFVVTRGLFWKAFLGFAVIGSIILAGLGAWHK